MSTIALSASPIEWRNGQPFAKAFQDIYFSTDNGLKETEYVFLSQNNLAHRFNTLRAESFIIAETGFGTGLNFLSTWKLWEEKASANNHLHFISIEKYPLNVDDLNQALHYWPTLSHYSQQLLKQYPKKISRYHQCVFGNGQITLSLFIGDIQEQLINLNTPIDAWFLDGFSPAKNPDMWTHHLFLKMAQLAKKQTTFATFTSAGSVRRGLQEAGFTVKKQPGFGKKREMLSGFFGEKTD